MMYSVNATEYNATTGRNENITHEIEADSFDVVHDPASGYRYLIFKSVEGKQVALFQTFNSVRQVVTE